MSSAENPPSSSKEQLTAEETAFIRRRKMKFDFSLDKDNYRIYIRDKDDPRWAHEVLEYCLYLNGKKIALIWGCVENEEKAPPKSLQYRLSVDFDEEGSDDDAGEDEKLDTTPAKVKTLEDIELPKKWVTWVGEQQSCMYTSGEEQWESLDDHAEQAQIKITKLCIYYRSFF